MAGRDERVRVIRGVRVWSGTPAVGVAPDATAIRIEGERIAQIDPRAGDAPEVRASASYFAYDEHENAFAIPGLIDAHVHMGVDPRVRVAEQGGVPAAERHAAMRARALRMLRSGITTARDLGGGDGAEIELRDAIGQSQVPGPRLLCAGQPVTTRGGHCHFWGGEASDLDAARGVIDRQVERAVDWIKVMATGGVATQGTSPGDVQFDPRELAEIVAHAALRGRRVAAHCHGTRGIANAVTAGVHTIEHCSFAGKSGFGSDFSAELVRAIAAAGSWVSPTVNGGWARRAEPTATGAPSDFFVRMSRVLRALVEAGVPLVASTDAGIPGVFHHRLAEGLIALGRYAGLEGDALLRTATSDAARALGIDTETGRIAPGLCADIVVVPGDPRADPSVLLRPLGVFARGQHYAPLPFEER